MHHVCHYPNHVTSKFVKEFQEFQAQFIFPNHMPTHVFIRNINSNQSPKVMLIVSLLI